FAQQGNLYIMNKNRFLKLLIACIASVGIRYVFNSSNFDTSDFVFSIIFGIIIWIILIIQRKI
ncbi:hypothetical protein, partial [Flavobacterium sp. YO12]|uniref:hypothetical protein n=1 Tax=Flavobacterium sp. YO12 TaxID=1920029 RepID=UPI001026BB04